MNWQRALPPGVPTFGVTLPTIVATPTRLSPYTTGAPLRPQKRAGQGAAAREADDPAIGSGFVCRPGVTEEELNTAHVLVVDDEVGFTDMASTALREEGLL